MKIIKISRGQYQVVDQYGNEKFPYPTSHHDCNLLIQGIKADEKFLANDRMQKVAIKFINDNNIKGYGDLYQFMANSIYKMYHKDIIELMRRKEFYYDHLVKIAAVNKAAREAHNLNNNNMSNVTKEEGPLEFAHGMVHEISFSLSQGDQIKAKEQLRELDVYLHDAIHQQSLTEEA